MRKSDGIRHVWPTTVSNPDDLNMMRWSTGYKSERVYVLFWPISIPELQTNCFHVICVEILARKANTVPGAESSLFAKYKY